MQVDLCRLVSYRACSKNLSNLISAVSKWLPEDRSHISFPDVLPGPAESRLLASAQVSLLAINSLCNCQYISSCISNSMQCKLKILRWIGDALSAHWVWPDKHQNAMLVCKAASLYQSTNRVSWHAQHCTAKVSKNLVYCICKIVWTMLAWLLLRHIRPFWPLMAYSILFFVCWVAWVLLGIKAPVMTPRGTEFPFCFVSVQRGFNAYGDRVYL